MLIYSCNKNDKEKSLTPYLLIASPHDRCPTINRLENLIVYRSAIGSVTVTEMELIPSCNACHNYVHFSAMTPFQPFVKVDNGVFLL